MKKAIMDFEFWMLDYLGFFGFSILNSKSIIHNTKLIGGKKGFTLLELLIAMTLLTLIVTITMGAMRLASRSVEAGEGRMEIQERFRMVSAIMDAQIQSQLPLTYEEEGVRINYFRGDKQTLRLATAHSLWGGRRGHVIVDYRVETGAGGQSLMASEQTPGIEGSRETPLFTAVSEISFEYYHKDPAEEVGKWSGEWSDETTIPEAVRLYVRYGPKKYFFLFPVRTQGERVPVPLTPAT